MAKMRYNNMVTKMLLLSTSMEAGRPRTSNRGDNNSYQNPREASSRPRIFLNSLEYLFVYLCHASWPNEKRYRPEIWYSYSHWSYLKTGFLFFSKKSPWLQLALKSCRVTWIFRIPPRLFCLYSYSPDLLFLTFSRLFVYSTEQRAQKIVSWYIVTLP